MIIGLCLVIIMSTGCDSRQNRELINDTNDPQMTILNENEHLANMEQKDSEIQELLEKLDTINIKNNELVARIDNLENEKKQFFIADRFGRKLYQAMVFNDVEQLMELTKTSNLQVFDNRFEQQVGEELVQIPFSHLQTEVHLNNEVIVKTNGYGFDDDLQVMRIHYTIIEPEGYRNDGLYSEYFLNVNLMKVKTLEWTIIDVEFDI